jgi:hypothetical protein
LNSRADFGGSCILIEPDSAGAVMFSVRKHRQRATREGPEHGHVCDAGTEESARATVAALNRAAETVLQHIPGYERRITELAIPE